MEARRWGVQQVLNIQEEVNVGARACGDPEYFLINDEEKTAIEALIEANTWPQKWTGEEPRGDVPFHEVDIDGYLQVPIFEMRSV